MDNQCIDGKETIDKRQTDDRQVRFSQMEFSTVDTRPILYIVLAIPLHLSNSIIQLTLQDFLVLRDLITSLIPILEVLQILLLNDEIFFFNRFVVSHTKLRLQIRSHCSKQTINHNLHKQQIDKIYYRQIGTRQ